MDYRKNMITLNTDGDDFQSEFNFIKNLIEVNDINSGIGNIQGLHIFMEAEFGPLWRIICFHIIDVSSNDPDERMELLQALKVNFKRDCDGSLEFDIDTYTEESEQNLDESKLLLTMFRENLNDGQINLAHQYAVQGLATPDISIEMIIELLFFFVRYDKGYVIIARFSDQLLPTLSRPNQKVLTGFLLKLMDIGYLEKSDLTAHALSYFIEIEGEST